MTARRQPSSPSSRRASSASSHSSKVFSYYATGQGPERLTAKPRTAAPSSKVSRASRHRRRPVTWVGRLPAAIALLVIAICCVEIMSLTANVKVVPIAGDSPASRFFLQETPAYQRAAQTVFASSILNRSKLTADTTHLTRQLQAEFPELQTVSVTLPLIGHRPIVYIQPAVPVIILTTPSGGVYLLDAEGKALLGVAGSDGGRLSQLRLVTVRDDSGLGVKVGQVALPSSDVAFITQVVGQLQEKGLTIAALELPAGASELDVHLQGVSYEARYNMQGDAREQAGGFLATKQYLEAAHITPAQYIDVRVPERAYYK